MRIEPYDCPLARRGPRLAVMLAVACLALFAAPCLAVSMQQEDTEGSVTISIEADSYWRSYNAGGVTIWRGELGNTGERGVTGLDYTGDWIMLTAKVEEPIFFRISLRAAEERGLRARFAVEFSSRGPGVVPAGDTLTTPLGMGAC